MLCRAINLAEREGFEPSVPLRVHRISSAALSTTQPPLRDDLNYRVLLNKSSLLIHEEFRPRWSVGLGINNLYWLPIWHFKPIANDGLTGSGFGF